MKVNGSEMTFDIILAIECEFWGDSSFLQQIEDESRHLIVSDLLDELCTFTRLPFLCNTFRLQLEIQMVSWLNSAPATGLNFRNWQDDLGASASSQLYNSEKLLDKSKLSKKEAYFYAHLQPPQGSLSHTQQSSNCTKHSHGQKLKKWVVILAPAN